MMRITAFLAAAGCIHSVAAEALTTDVSLDASMEAQVILKAEMRYKQMRSMAKDMSATTAAKNVDAKIGAHGTQNAASLLGMAKLTKDTATKAVKTLNEMYLAAEEELDEKIFECTVERLEQLKSIAITDAELTEIAAASTDADGKKGEAISTFQTADEDMNTQINELQQLTKDYEEVKANNDRELNTLSADLAVMAFILEIAQCKTEAQLMLRQKHSAEFMSCQAQNAKNEMYLVNLFSDKEVQRRVDEELSAAQKARLQKVLGEMGTGPNGMPQDTQAEEKGADAQIESDEKKMESESAQAAQEEEGEAHSGVSFLQRALSTQPSDGFKTCQSMKPDCTIMTDKVGGMYGDARDKVDHKMDEM
jgi:hypothetical protein